MDFDYSWENYSFAPITQDGWHFVLACLADDKVEITSAPVAGWVTQVERRYDPHSLEDVNDERPAHQIARRIEPAIWHQGDEVLEALSDLDHVTNVVAVLVGPGMPEPSPTEMEAEVRAKAERVHARMASVRSAAP